MTEPFVGRESELDRLEAAVDEVRSGRGGVVLMAGEPGIGKTRLARELEALAVERGARVLWGRAHEAGGVLAYWPWTQALRTLIADASDDELRGWLGGSSEVLRILPELREHMPELAEPEPIADPESA